MPDKNVIISALSTHRKSIQLMWKKKSIRNFEHFFN